MDEWGEVQLPERSQFKSFGELKISVCLSEMGDTDEAHHSDFEDTIACVFTNEDVQSQRGYSPLDLDVYPDEVLSIEQHQRDQLFVDVLGKGLEGETSDVSLHEAKELVQHFALDSDHLTSSQKG